MNRHPAILVVILASVLLVSYLGISGAAALRIRLAEVHSQGSDQLTITVGGVFSFSPNSFQVTPGDSVTVTIEQTSSLAHTFTLSSLANYQIPSSATNLSQFFSSHPPLASVNISGTPGGSATVSFTAPALGYYEFVCLQPGHFPSGMYGFIGSGVAPPNAAPPNTGPGLPVFIIVGVIVALVVIALVLGFVVGKREGSKHEMPPERVGYAEPPSPPQAEPPRTQ